MPMLIAGNAMLRAPSSSASRRLDRYAPASSSGSPSPPPRQIGPTAWSTQRAGRSCASVATAVPVGVPSGYRRRSSSRRPGPAARWMAPSTPPPPRSRSFAAFAMASTRSAVMSPRDSSRRRPPTMMKSVADAMVNAKRGWRARRFEGPRAGRRGARPRCRSATRARARPPAPAPGTPTPAAPRPCSPR